MNNHAAVLNHQAVILKNTAPHRMAASRRHVLRAPRMMTTCVLRAMGQTGRGGGMLATRARGRLARSSTLDLGRPDRSLA